MTFSMTPEVPQGGSISSEEYEVWNEYYWGLFDAKEAQAVNAKGEEREGVLVKRKKYVGVCKGIVDCGLQPQMDSSYEWKGVAGKGDQLSEEEQAHVVKYPDNYFKDVDGKRMQFKPERPTQEFAFYVDFPKIVIDWTKHPSEKLHHLGEKPLRVCVNGYVNIPSRNVNDFAKHFRFNPNYKTGKLSPNNPIMKLATSLSCVDAYNVKYDIGAFVNQAANFTLAVERNGRYFNEKIVDHSEITDIEVGDNVITREDQIPECSSVFMGAKLVQESYDEDTLDWISHRRELQAMLPKATSFQPNAVKNPDFWLGLKWEDSKLCKALSEKGVNWGKVSTSTEQPVEQKSTPQEDKPVQEKVSTPKPEYNEPEIDFDSEIPF